ncbi:unnamed protein product [Jaminaea pallidilutea]
MVRAIAYVVALSLLLVQLVAASTSVPPHFEDHHSGKQLLNHGKRQDIGHAPEPAAGLGSGNGVAPQVTAQSVPAGSSIDRTTSAPTTTAAAGSAIPPSSSSSSNSTQSSNSSSSSGGGATATPIPAGNPLAGASSVVSSLVSQGSSIVNNVTSAIPTYSPGTSSSTQAPDNAATVARIDASLLGLAMCLVAAAIGAGALL